MTEALIAVAVFLLASLFAGMVRILRGPTEGDRMVAAQLFGTTAVAILLLLGAAYNASSLIDVALVFALLAALTAIAFVRCAWIEKGAGDGT